MTRRASAEEQVKCLFLSVLLCGRYVLFRACTWKGKLQIQSVHVGAQAASLGDREQDEKAGEMTFPGPLTNPFRVAS